MFKLHTVLRLGENESTDTKGNLIVIVFPFDVLVRLRFHSELFSLSRETRHGQSPAHYTKAQCYFRASRACLNGGLMVCT